MKHLKRIVHLNMMPIITLSLFLCVISFQNMQRDDAEYQRYLYEEAHILLEVKGFDSAGYSVDEYRKKFREYKHFYETLSKNKAVTDFDIFYIMPVSIHHEYGYGHLYLVSASRLKYEKNNEFMEDPYHIHGRYFTNEELLGDEPIAIINENLKYEDYTQIEIGDFITVSLFYSDVEMLPVKLQTVGKYKSNRGFFTVDNHYKWIDDFEMHIYMPNQAIMDISDYWLDHLDEIDGKYEFFYPMSIANAYYEFENENDYHQFIEDFNIHTEMLDEPLEYKRLDEHQRTFDIHVIHTQFTVTVIFTAVLLLLWFFIILVINQYQKRQDHLFNQMVIGEKEKNIENILLTNQQSHKLKHDLKHFINQARALTVYDQKEELLKFLDEFQEDIDSLMIPAYTCNKTLDLIINQYKLQADKVHLDFTYSVLAFDCDLSDRKLYLLLSNALDNAFIHCDANYPFVNLSMTLLNGYYRIRITNSIGSVLREVREGNEHGYGIKSMKQVVEEVGGVIEFEKTETYYQCTFLLPLSKNSNGKK